MQTHCEGHSLKQKGVKHKCPGQTFAFPPWPSLDTSKVQVKQLTGSPRPVNICAESVWAVKVPSLNVRCSLDKALEASSEKGSTVETFIGNPSSVGSDLPVWLRENLCWE